MSNDNSTQVLRLYAKELRIPVTRQTLNDELQKHPDYNSMLAFSDVLDRFHVPNAAYELNFDQLTDVPLPFVAFINHGEFALVSKFDEKHAVLSNERWKNKAFSGDEFKKIYSGSVFIAEKDEESGEADYAKKYKKEIAESWRLPVVFTGAAVILLAFLLLHTSYLNALSLPTGFLTIFKTAGLITSILLLIQSIDTNNPLIQKLCGGDNNKDCNAILSSKAAKINDSLSWSEIGFFYFAGTWLVLLFNSGHTSIIQMLALLNIVSLPYTFYSVYYQWRVAKQWCVFCCTVQALLWLEFFAFLPSVLHGLQMPTLIEWSSLAMGMAIPVLGWILVKPYLLQAIQIAPLKAQLRRFKYNKDLFNKMLNDEVKYTLPDEEHALIIGNREAEHVITMVSNPYCQPCSRAHKQLDEWLPKRDNVKLQVVFSVGENEQDKKNVVASHLMALQADGDEKVLKHALDDWYEQKQKNYEAWAKEYPVTAQTLNAEALQKQREWCKLAEITGTPTLFINGRRIPNLYQTADIKYFI